MSRVSCREIDNMKNFALVVVLFNAAIISCIGDRLLLFGDSVDRYIVQDWCGHKHGNGSVWAADMIKYAGSRFVATYHCSHGNDSAAFVHLFGSAPVGPYHHTEWNSTDPFVNTSSRIHKALTLYLGLFGIPDRVMFQTIQWDMKDLINKHAGRIIKHSSLWEASMAVFRNNTLDRLAEIRHILGHLDVRIGLRAAAWSSGKTLGAELIRDCNKIVEEIATLQNLTFYDMGNDIWSSVQYDYSLEKHLFRDDVHPVAFFTIAAAEKLLGNVYNSYMTSGNREPLSPPHQLARLLHTKHVIDDVFYVNQLPNGTVARWSHVTADFTRFFHLGPGDVKVVPDGELEEIPLMGPIPSHLAHVESYKVVGFRKKNGSVWILDHSTLRRVHNADELKWFGLGPDDLVNVTSPFSFLTFLPQGSDVPDIFTDGKIFRWIETQGIWIFEQGKKRNIPSIEIFRAHGWRWDDTVMLTHEEKYDFEGIPVGQRVT